jgi:transposase
MVAASARCAIGFSLSPGRAGDAPEGRALLHSIHGAPPLPVACHLLIDCAYEGNETRHLALDLGFIPVTPPHPSRVDPWPLKKALYRRRNEIGRLFRRLKGFRRIFSASTSLIWCSSPSSTSFLSWKHCVSSVKKR